ncbi:hypothetical protein ACWERY_10960 [Streptomyces sp. NPDC004082]|uniref:hypothetical protein n=1 Tax=unclassified Streptomyces TaxID=2593676 RepID=UPI0033A7FD49
MAAATVGTLIRDGYGGPDTCHAFYCALPRAEFTGMCILLTEHEDHYPSGVITVDINSPACSASTEVDPHPPRAAPTPITTATSADHSCPTLCASCPA